MKKYDQLHPASLSSFPFGVPVDSVFAGKRMVTHQYPGKNDPSHEDMGDDVRTYIVI